MFVLRQFFSKGSLSRDYVGCCWLIRSFNITRQQGSQLTMCIPTLLWLYFRVSLTDALKSYFRLRRCCFREPQRKCLGKIFHGDACVSFCVCLIAFFKAHFFLRVYMQELVYTVLTTHKTLKGGLNLNFVFTPLLVFSQQPTPQHVLLYQLSPQNYFKTVKTILVLYFSSFHFYSDDDPQLC